MSEKLEKLVYVEWVDSCQSHGWQSIEELNSQRAMCCFSVGWLVAESEDSITLAGNVSEKNHPTAFYQCCGVMTIPQKAIVYRQEITSSISSDRAPE